MPKQMKGRCHVCDELASIRFKKKNWCAPCFEVAENTLEPLKLEDFVHQDSALARADETQPEVSGIDASYSNRVAGAAMRKTGIPTWALTWGKQPGGERT